MQKKIPTFFIDYSRTENGKNEIIDFFVNDFFSKYIFEDESDLLIEELNDLVKSDDEISNKEKEKVFSLKDKISEEEYLANLYLLALKRSKVLTLVNNEIIKKETTVSHNKFEIVDGELFFGGAKINVPERIIPEKNINLQEEKYVSELLFAYAEDKNIEKVTIDSIPNEYQSHFQRNREYYYSAVRIKRRLRDIIPIEFENFKEDIFEGIVEVVGKDYPNSYQRIENTFIHISQMEKTKSRIEELKGWIGLKERKGVCHMLVNEGKISWKK